MSNGLDRLLNGLQSSGQSVLLDAAQEYYGACDASKEKQLQQWEELLKQANDEDKAHQDEMCELAGKMEVQRLTMETVQTVIDELKTQLATSEKKELEEIAAKDKLEKELTQALAAHEKLELGLNQLEDQVAKLEKKQEEIATQIKKGKKDMATEEKSAQTVQEKKEGAQKTEQEIRDESAVKALEIDRVKAEQEEQRIELQNLQEDLREKQKEERDEIKEFRVQEDLIRKLNQEIGFSERLVEDDQDEFERVENELTTYENEEKDLEAKIETLQNELRNTKDEANIINEGEKAEYTEHVSHEMEREDLQSQIEQAKARLADIRGKISDFRNRREALRQSIRAEERQLSQKRADMEVAEYARDMHQENIASLKEEIMERKGNITVINTEIAKLKDQHKVLNAEQVALLGSQKDIEKFLARCKQNIEKHERQLKDLENKNSQLETQTENMRSNLDAKKDTITKDKQEIDTAAKTLVQKSELLRDLKTEIASLRVHKQANEKQVESAKTKMNSLNAQVEDLSTRRKKNAENRNKFQNTAKRLQQALKQKAKTNQE